MLYTAYQLVIETPFPCSALPLAPAGSEPDVIVTDGDVPRQLDAPTVEESNWQAAPGRFLYRGGGRAGRFLVEGGSRITFRRSPAAEDEMVAFHFLDAVLAAVLRHRGLLILHANAAARPDGTAVAVTGESGAGKSTTLAALLQRGCTMLSDDITALRLGANGNVDVLTGIPQFHLTEDSGAGLGRDLSGLPRFPWRRMKTAVPASAMMAEAPASLEALYWIEACPIDEIRITALQGAIKFAALQNSIYGPLLPEEHPDLFPLFAAVTERVAVYHIQRPAGKWTTDEIVTQMLGDTSPA